MRLSIPLNPFSQAFVSKHSYISCSSCFLSTPPTMDPVKMGKLQAMEGYRRNHILLLFVQYILRVVLVGLFLSCPSWLPLICSSIKFFFLVCLPNIGAMVTGPKFIFIVSNIIVILLVGESRLSESPAQPDVYDEYVVRSQTLQRVASVEVKAKEVVVGEALFEETKEKDEAAKEEEVTGGAGEEERERVCEDLLEEEDEGLPAEEINRRVEDFIAKVNMQRRVEARMLLCYE